VGLALLASGPAPAWAQGGGADSVHVTWIAPGDDGTVGIATLYELRISHAPITPANWGGAALVPGLPLPLLAGTRQAATVRGLSSDTTYYLAIRTVDDAGNWSGLSDVVRWDWTPNTVPPASPVGLTAVLDGPNVRLSWTANHEPDLGGYSAYRSTAAGGPYTKLNASLVAATEFLDSNLPPGATALWYEVTASDAAGESAPSTAARADLSGVRTVAAWTVSAPYPNPSTSMQSVCIPVAVPAAGAGDAVVDVLDIAGRRVRHLALASAPGCAGGGLVWDGRNDAGSAVAPGLYSVRLTAAGELRSETRLVRQP
jgi:hypothetical protein